MVTQWRERIAVLLLTLAVAACGGGGSSSSGTNNNSTGGNGNGSGGVQLSIGGAVTGLAGTGLVLQNNGGDETSVASDGTFSFATKLSDGASYAVTIKSQPTGQLCKVANGSGTLSGANVTNVAITCANLYTVGGSVSGLGGGTVVLQNNGGDDLSLSSDGNFTFPTSLVDGDNFHVTIKSSPAYPKRVCTVHNGDGRINSANFPLVLVSCVNETIILGTANWGDTSLKFTDGFADIASGFGAVPRVVAGPTTTLSALTVVDSLAIDRQRSLAYVINGDFTLKVFNSLLTINGDVAPTRSISLPPPGGYFTAVAVDAGHDRLYLGDDISNVIYVYAGASAVNGAKDPDAVLSTTGGVKSLHYDEVNDSLYAVTGLAGTVEVFHLASVAVTGATASRTFTVEKGVTGLRSVWVDGHNDRLYVASRAPSSGGDNVFVFDAASGLSGDYDADTNSSAHFAYPVAMAIAIDSDDTLYVVADSATAVDAYANARLLSGAVTATPRLVVDAINKGYGMDYLGH